ncbi:transposon Tf2-9 polyprotein [Trichonephila clavipes]|nr:transposon Tf2-9 polyprotein [Trichonephila clavipes]
MNCGPLSLISLRGKPYRRSTSSISVWAQFSAVASARAKSSTHLVLVSSTIKIHFLPVRVSGRGPKRSVRDSFCRDFLSLDGCTCQLFFESTKRALITIRGVEVAANQGAATILRENIAITISDSGRSASLANAYSRAASMSRETNPSSRRRANPAADILGRKFRLFVKDRETGCQFLVDSGADVSILPWTKTKGECQASQYKLYAANGTEIPTYGLKILMLDLGLRRPFQWPFIIAKVKRGIIGADFLQKFQLLIDLHNRKLIDGVTNLSIKGEVATIQENNDLSTVNRASKYFNLLKSYPDLTKPNLIPIAEEDKEKTAITTPFGLYEFNTMSFGLRNAPSTFQRFITEVLHGLDFVFPYLDDVLVASSTEEEHSEHLKMDAAKTQAPLHELLRGAKKKKDLSRKVHWTDDTRRSFEKCKTDLAEAALLSFPRSGLPLSLCTDASDFAVGAVLQQLENEGWKPIAFYSKKLNETQTRYSTYDRELLGIYLSVKHFKHLLEGNDFDHKPLTFAFKQKNEKASPRQQRQLQHISEFSCNIQHVLGKDNVVADALSRIDSISEINFEEIAEEQTTDEELQQLLHNNSLKFKPSTLPSGKKLWCDISTQKIRPYIPHKFRFQILQLIHGLAHPGIKSTVKLMTEKYVWSDIKKQVREWAKACIRCQKCKVSRHTKSKLGEFEQPDERFSVVHMDLIGKLPPSEGMQYCLTCIDRFSCWMEAIPIPEITAEIAGRAFYEKCICRLVCGVPDKLVTDQGRQFEAELFRSIAAICGAKVAHTTSYHPQCNGKVERLHRTLKGAIKAHNNIRWTESLPTVLLGLRAAIRPDISYTIAQMVYGTSIKLPGEFLIPYY